MNRKELDRLKMQLKQFFQNTKIDSILPVALIALVNLLAFINLECCIIVFLVLPVGLSSYYIYCAKKSARFVAVEFICNPSWIFFFFQNEFLLRFHYLFRNIFAGTVRVFRATSRTSPTRKLCLYRFDICVCVLFLQGKQQTLLLTIWRKFLILDKAKVVAQPTWSHWAYQARWSSHSACRRRQNSRVWRRVWARGSK